MNRSDIKGCISVVRTSLFENTTSNTDIVFNKDLTLNMITYTLSTNFYIILGTKDIKFTIKFNRQHYILKVVSIIISTSTQIDSHKFTRNAFGSCCIKRRVFGKCHSCSLCKLYVNDMWHFIEQNVLLLCETFDNKDIRII